MPRPVELQHTCPQRLNILEAGFLQHGIGRRLRGCRLGGAGRRASMPAAIFRSWLRRKAAHGSPRLHTKLLRGRKQGSVAGSCAISIVLKASDRIGHELKHQWVRQLNWTRAEHDQGRDQRSESISQATQCALGKPLSA